MKALSLTTTQLLKSTAIKAKCSVRTQYACEVVGVSGDGRFVDVVHNILQWVPDFQGDITLINPWGVDITCSPSEPWILKDIPVEQAYVRGQWSIQARPRIGDKGILSVFYHDLTALKEKGGFQSPPTLRVMAMDSASWRPGLPNHADVNAESGTYPDDDNFIINGNGISLSLTAPNNAESVSPRVAKLTIGGVSATITVPKDAAPTVVFDVPDGAISVNAKTANVNLTESATLTTPQTTITGNVDIGGNVTIGGTADITGATTVGANLDVSGNITGAEVKAGTTVLTTHIHSGGTINGQTGAPV